MAEKLFTPEEVASLLRVKVVTVHSWLRQGKLKGFRVGGRLWRISREQLQEFLNFDLDYLDLDELQKKERHSR
jgi:excisionase family DNA binding protein